MPSTGIGIARLRRWLHLLRSRLWKRTALAWVRRAKPSLDRHATLESFRILAEEYRHVRSVDEVASLDGPGEPIPFYTYPALDYLARLPIAGSRVFEFGSGNSSLYYEKRGCEVIAAEPHHTWREFITEQSEGRVQFAVVDPDDDLAYGRSILSSQDDFDIIVIDGIHRLLCAHYALEKLLPSGFIILDNAEWCPRTARRLRNAGLTEISLTGFGPINGNIWTTSFFLGPDCRPDPIGDPAPLGSARVLQDGVFVDIDVSPRGPDRRLVPGHLDEWEARRELEWNFEDANAETGWQVDPGHELEWIDDGYAGLRAGRLSSTTALTGTSLDREPISGIWLEVPPEKARRLSSRTIEITIHSRTDSQSPTGTAAVGCGPSSAPGLHGEWASFEPGRRFSIRKARFEIPELARNESLRVALRADASGGEGAIQVDSVSLFPVADESS